MRKLVLLSCVLSVCLTPVAGRGATLLVSPFAPEEASLSFDYSLAQVRYRVPTDRFYISRSIQSVSWGYQSFFATLGYVQETDFKDFAAGTPEDQPGWVAGVGARGAAWRSGDFSTLLHAQFHALNEQVEWNGRSRDLQSLEVLAGADAVWTPGPFALYAGFEAVPYSELSFKIAELGKVERTDFIILRAGGRIPFGPLTLNVEVPFIGAEGVRIGLDFAF